MSQHGRSGFLSYLLLLSRLLQFELGAEQVGAPQAGCTLGEGETPKTWAYAASAHTGFLPQANPSSWQGALSGAATTVLCLHGAQNDLSPLQLAVL